MNRAVRTSAVPALLLSATMLAGCASTKPPQISYDNTVPLFEGGAKGLRDALARVVTDSRLPGEAKDAQSSHLVAMFDAFASDVASRASCPAIAFNSSAQSSAVCANAPAWSRLEANATSP